MVNKILIVIPSYGRPAQLLEAVGSILGTSTGLADVLVVFDNRDPERLSLAGRHLDSMTSSGTMLRAFADGIMGRTSYYDILGLAADDIRYRTHGWDKRVCGALDGKCGVVYGDDGIQHASLPTHPFFSATIPKALGYAVPPVLKHYYFDNFMRAIGQGLDCYEYLSDVVTEHLHHSVGKSVYDGAYKRVERYESEDRKCFFNYASDGLEYDLTILRKYLAPTQPLRA